MADTMLGDFPELICSDCGEKGCIYKHWGPLVPKGEIGTFCSFCWGVRDKRGDRHPLGVQPPGIPEEFTGRNLEVTTESGSIYLLNRTAEKDECSVSRQEDLPFSTARVLCLCVGESLAFKMRDGDQGCWFSRPVTKIRVI